MRKFNLLPIVIALFFLSNQNQIFAQAAQFSSNGTTMKAAKLTFTNGTYSTKAVTVNGTPSFTIEVEESSRILEPGAPDLPKFTTAIVIPDHGSSEIQVTYTGFTDIPNMEIAPSKGNLYRNTLPSDVAYSFGTSYQTDAFYPGKLGELKDPYLLRDKRGQVVVLYPYQYNPITKVLRIYEDLTVQVKFNDEQGINENNDSRTIRVGAYNAIYDNMFLNNDDVESMVRYTPVEETGTMLVICPQSLQGTIMPLLDWKTEKGIYNEMVDIAFVGNDENDIMTYVQNYYDNNPNFLYLLLVGDHPLINTASFGTSSMGEELWSDTKYAFLAGSDTYPEVFVGRLSANNTSELSNQVDRILEYEKTPMAGAHYTRAIGLASDEGAGNGDDGEADWEHMRNMREDLLGYGFTEVHEFYDGTQGGEDASGNPNASMVQEAVNGGITLFNYTGHGDENTCITGYYSSYEINEATNNGMYPFVISVACNNGTFTSSTCISEAWTRASNSTGPTGAIAACGSSILMSWAPPMATQDEMTDILVESYAENKKTTLGGLFYNAQMKMLDDYSGGWSSGEEVMQTWIMFGDPSVQMRTLDPANMNVTHASTTGTGTVSMDVNCNMEGAVIAITQNGVILGTGVVSGGVATVTFNDPITSTDDLLVTATAYNQNPYQGQVTISGVNNIENQSITMNTVQVYPNPASEHVTVLLNTDMSNPWAAMLYNSVGKLVMNLETMVSNGTSLNFSVQDLDQGIYFLDIKSNFGQSREKIVIQ